MAFPGTPTRPLCLQNICGLVLLLLALAVPARAGEQAERAIQAVKALVAAGKVSQDAVIKVVVKPGNINNFWGNNFELKNEWERETGIRLDVSTRPQTPVLEFMRHQKDFDITVVRQREYPDLVVEKLVVDLTDWIAKYGFTWDENPQNGYYRLAAQAEFNHRVIAIPADGDIATLYLRKDLLENPQSRAEFKKKYQRELTVPRTWDDYQTQVEFFHNPQQGFYGSCEEREPDTGWMFWMSRYVSRAAPNKYLFDAQMRPLIDSPDGIAATESYIRTVPFSPPGILDRGNNYSFTVPIFRRGDCFANIITMAGAKIYNMDTAEVKDRFVTLPLPGTSVGGQLIRRPTFIYGNNLAVARNSAQPELAFLYIMWLTDPDISTRSIQVVSGFTDPYRNNHLSDPQTAKIYTQQALDTLAAQIDSAIPAGTGLPGDAEYIAALNHNLWLAAKGNLTAAAAMRKTAAEWEQITERYGRASQVRYWQAFIKKFPGQPAE